MKRLADFRRFSFVILLVLLTANLWGQSSSLNGSGTQNDPYLIDSNEDWETFVNDVNDFGYDYSGKYVKLNSDVPNPDEVAAGTTAVTKMVGVWDAEVANRRPFSGTFLGNNNTIIVDYENSVTGKYTAPFVCTKGATIKQLNVVGEIVSTVGYAAGLIGGNYGSKTKIENTVNVSVDITNGSNASAGDYCAGVAIDGTSLEISSCVYNGKIIAGNNSAGFVAIGNSNNTKINNCLFVPADGSLISGGENFSNALNYSSKNYYTYKVGTSTQGTQAYATYEGTPDEGCFEFKELYDGNSYYVPGTAAITGLLSSYYQRYAKSGGITYNITFNGVVIDNDKFTEGIYNGNDEEVNVTTIEPGSYTLKIRGIEGYYKGLLTASITIVEDVLEGSGTEDEPYRIGTPANWTAFATAVSGGHTFVGEFLKLTDDVIITDGTMAGANNKNFSGTFDGNYQKLTFNCGTDASPYDQDVCAPFRYIENATIKNLTIDGIIFSKQKYVGGFAGYASGTNTIYNCTSDINIKCRKEGDCTNGGFVARELDGGVINFNKCLFGGRIVDDRPTTTATKCAGFVGWAANTVNYTECFMVGEISVAGMVGNFHRTNGSSLGDSNTRYLISYEDVEDPNHGPSGRILAQLESNPPLSKKYEYNDVTYYLPVSLVLGLESTNYDGKAKTPHVNYYGKTVDLANYTIGIKKKDGSGNYTIIPDPYEINTAGDYQVTITGIGAYERDEIVLFKIIAAGERWSDLQYKLNHDSSPIVLDRDYVALENDAPISINRDDITIDLNGYKIDRNLQEAKVNGYVLRIEKNNTVTIKDNSTEHTGYITGGFNIHDGGGIYNNGNLTLNDVTIKDNKVVKKAGESASGRGAGIYSTDASTLTINGGLFYNNRAVGGGGALYSNKAILNMTGVTFENNYSTDKGGAIRLGVGGTGANITDCTFAGNSTGIQTESKGGALHLEGPKETSILNLTNCLFVNNFAYKTGGAIYSIKGHIIATNCTITGNQAEDEVGIGDKISTGGAVSLYQGSTFTMIGGTISDNFAMSNGGAIYIYKGAKLQVSGDVKIENCVVLDTRDLENIIYYKSNVYANAGEAIEVVGDLAPTARIGISQKSGTGTAVKSTGSYTTSLDNFVLDNEPEKRLRKDASGNIIVYNVYPWNASYTWNSAASSLGHEPLAGDAVTINLAVEIPEGYEANAGNITITDTNKGEIIIEEGGQLINSNSINATVRKNIAKTTTNENGWYAISSAVHDSDHDYESMSNIENIDVAYAYKDMFRYNEATSMWENQENEQGAAGFTTLDMGRGYLYRNTDDIMLSYKGKTNVDDVTYNLSCAASNENLRGFNLVGNPFTQNITLLNTTLLNNNGTQLKDGDNDVNLTGFYRITSEGAWSTKITSTSEPIAVNEGFLIQIPEAAKKIKFSKTARGASKANPKSIMFTIENSEYSDVTYAIFEQGLGLNKISHHNETIPMLYINQKDKDYAIATMDKDTKTFNLGFKATSTGMYTLRLKTEGEFGYIHIIDKFAEKDIDMLQEGEYSFIGSTADNEDRFIVRLAYMPDNNDDEEIFAYQNGNEVLVSGEGTLQVFDVMGRLVMQKQVNGVETIATSLATGVYIMKLNDKTQKIIIK